jgi:hypothetical protein
MVPLRVEAIICHINCKFSLCFFILNAMNFLSTVYYHYIYLNVNIRRPPPKMVI